MNDGYNDPPVCTYCLGAGRVIAGGLLSYWWWRLTGRAVHSRCPECGGYGFQHFREGA